MTQMYSAPYFCFTRAGRPGWVKWSHMYTTVFSRDGVMSSSSSILTPWCVMLLWDVNRLSWKNAFKRWNSVSGRSFGCRCIKDRSRKCAPVRWNPKCNLILCHTSSNEVESLRNEFRAMPGQKLAICPSISSRFLFFWAAVRRSPSGTVDPSSLRPWSGVLADFFFHDADRNGVNLSSRDKMYSKFCRQVSYELIVSLSVSGHCFGALCHDDMVIMLEFTYTYTVRGHSVHINVKHQ